MAVDGPERLADEQIVEMIAVVITGFGPPLGLESWDRANSAFRELVRELNRARATEGES